MQTLIQDDKVLILASYDEREIIKSMGDYKWNKKRKVWEFPLWKLPKLATYFKLEMDTKSKEVLLQQQQLNTDRANQLEAAQQIKIDHSSGKKLSTLSDNSQLMDKLFIHQKQALRISNLFDSYALFMETGTGKTLVAIRMIQLRSVRTLIVCPLSVIEGVWIPELEKWAPELRACNMWERMKKKQSFLTSKDGKDLHDVYIINFESFKKISHPEDMFDFIVIDESSKLKCNKTQITKKFISIRDKVKYRLILSGLPAPNNLLEYWGQMAFVNDRLLGSNFYAFRNKYFRTGGYGGFQYYAKQDAKESIMEKINEQAFHIKKNDCLDLPDRLVEKRVVHMTGPQETAYNDMKKQNIMEFKGHTTLAMNELSKIMKLREITSGFIITEAGMPMYISDTKLKVLKSILEDEIAHDKQVIVWCNFHFEIETLLKMFGDSACALYGNIPQKEKDHNIKMFQEGKKRLLFAHPLSGGMGLTFTNCSYMIWFSLSYSQEQHAQANDRIYRIGQTNKCTYIYLLAKDSIDEVIHAALIKKKDLAEACLGMLKG